MTPSLTKYTGVYKIIGRGIDAAPLTRNEVAEITKAVKAYNIKTTEEKEFDMPEVDFVNFRLEMSVLMLQNENSITLFSAD